MDNIDYGFDHLLQDNVHRVQFDRYMLTLYFLNDALHKEYDLIYQRMLYICLSEIFTEGSGCIDEIIRLSGRVCRKDPHRFEIVERAYLRLRKGIEELKSKFTPAELRYIEYMRHNVCHIRQWGYAEISQEGDAKHNPLVSTKIVDGKKTKMPLEPILEEINIIYA